MEGYVTAVCGAHPDALGLVVIVANRRGPLRGQDVLANVETDLKNISDAFEQLSFAVIQAKDMSCERMVALLHAVASYPDYPPSYKRIAVVFAGHGVEGALCAHDGTVPIKDIIDQFQPACCHPSIRGIPKLFFIDACRGDLRMGVTVAARGGTAVPSKVVTQYGNSLVAYSTMAGYKAYEVAGRGGMWMSHLSEKILQDKSILDIITDVNQSMMVELQKIDFQHYPQQPTCESNLNETVNLFREWQVQEGYSGDATATNSIHAVSPKTGPRPFPAMPHSTEQRSSRTVPGGVTMDVDQQTLSTEQQRVPPHPGEQPQLRERIPAGGHQISESPSQSLHSASHRAGQTIRISSRGNPFPTRALFGAGVLMVLLCVGSVLYLSLSKGNTPTAHKDKEQKSSQEYLQELPKHTDHLNHKGSSQQSPKPVETCRLELNPKNLANEVSAKVSTKWKSIGIQLGLLDNELKDIESQTAGKPERNMEASSLVLAKWKALGRSPYSWSVMIEALESPAVGAYDIAAELRTKCGKS